MRSNALVIAVVAAGGGAAAIIDLRTRRVPNELTLGVSALGVVLAASHLSAVSVAGALSGFGVGLLLMLPGYVVGATGAGDVKLLAAVGTLVGPTRIGVTFLYAALAGGVLALSIAVQRGRLQTTLEAVSTLVRTGGSNAAEIEDTSADNRFGYAPAIAVGALLAAAGL